ncbi:hypothetical protein QMG83_09010 [Salinibacterium sp. G-O1]|uniref:hypothetical protein n=1 Tax=Salinibacterium sp. G-O1 TaxID=3046208 RepID=UPI0024BA7319|nr:hypothetical protein [Salinibacterium sp. G-O1]MDJ0335361.1 hypothetical protein [Salinibacterium sp. G-O1]
MRTRPLPERKTLGTAWNLRPDTERVEARALRVGDVVMESPDHPFRIAKVTHQNGVIVHGKYVWQDDREKSWMLSRFSNSHVLDRAIPGEY